MPGQRIEKRCLESSKILRKRTSCDFVLAFGFGKPFTTEANKPEIGRIRGRRDGERDQVTLIKGIARKGIKGRGLEERNSISTAPGGESRRRRIDYLARLCANETAAARKYDRR